MSLLSKEDNVQTEENNVLLPPVSLESEEHNWFLKNASLPLSRKHLSSAQQADETLQRCVVSAD